MLHLGTIYFITLSGEDFVYGIFVSFCQVPHSSASFFFLEKREIDNFVDVSCGSTGMRALGIVETILINT